MLNTEQKNAKHQELLNTLKQEVEALFPMVSRNGKSINITSVHWDNAGIEMMNDLRAQKKAKLGESSIQSRLLANVEFKDEEGKSLDSKQGYVLMTMPHVTSRNSYILEGSELQVVNQLRLRPGLYTALKGEAEVETQLNTTASGSYKVLLDRRTGVLRFKSGTDKKVPIFSVLQALGSSDSDIKSLLKDLYDANFKASKPEKDTIKLLQSLNAYADVGTKMDNQIQIKEFLASKPLDPSVNKLTTGKEGIDKIDLQAVKEAVRKCVEVSNGAGEEDDKESLAFKSLHDVEDFIPERFRKSAPHLKRSIEFQMTNKETIAAVIPSTLFSKSVKDFMTSSQFTRYSDQNNPVDINAISSTITILGEGGIQNTQAITPQVRSVHPSHFGVLDVLHNQEGQQVGVTQHLSMGAKKVGNKIHLRVIDIKTGKPVEMSVEESMGYTVAFPDQYSGVGKGIPTVKGDLKEVKVRRGNKLLAVDPKEVEYLFNDAASFFGSSSNAVPFLPNNTANRVLMADKHIEQAVQLADPDKPLVQHRITGTGKGYLELFGEGLLVSSPIDGTVQKVKKDAITINGKDGDVEVTIHDYYPLNSKTFLTDTPIVKVGDKVVKGQALVENNFTKDKTLALGKNLSVAMIPYKGYNFEDGTVISQSAAMKLASVHKEEYRIEKGSDITVGLEDYIANYPKALQELPDGYREKYDNKGIVKKGEKVRKGDILIPALHEVSLRKTSLVDLHKKLLSNTYHDVSSVWDKDVEGVVIDVINDRKFVKVIVKSVEPAVVGDKLSAFAGAKGIITKILGPDEIYKDSNGKEIDVLFNPYGCHDSETEILTEDGWKLIQEVKVGDRVMGMDPVTQEARLEVVEHTTNREYTGFMYKVQNRKLDFLVSPEHELYSRKSSKVRHPYQAITATESQGLRRNYKKDCESWAGVTPASMIFEVNRPGVGPTGPTFSVDSHDFALFIGLLVGDGWASQSEAAFSNYSYNVVICQSASKPEVCEILENLVDRLPWKFTKTTKESGMFEWQCSNKELHAWITEHVGVGAKNKRIPRELLSWGRSALKLMLDGLIMTDGNVRWNKKTGHYGSRRYFTSSKLLADDVQELMLRTGSCGHITEDLRPAGSGFSKSDSRIYTVHELKTSEPSVNWSNVTKQKATEGWVPYDGTIHCVTVPSHMIYTRRNKIPMWGMNSVGRINPGFLLEAGAGKVAEKTGKTFYVDNFNTKHGSALKDVQDQLKAAGIDDEDTITNEHTGHKIPRVLVGPIHILKLKHKISGKFSARGATGSAYTTLEQPKKDVGESAQRIAPLSTFALLAGDANHFLDDAFRIKSQRNDDYWMALQLGHNLPAPKTPFVTEKLVAMLLAAGVNLNQTGDNITAGPMTDAEIRRISHGEIDSPGTLRAPNLTAMKGGLFDPDVTGGIGGNKFAHIKLSEPVVNPLMREAVISVGGFESGVELEKVLLHEAGVNEDGVVVETGGTRGIEGVIQKLKGVDLEKELEAAAEVASRSKATALNKANKKIRYIKALQSLKMRPEDAYVNKLVPVLPPKYRQITEMPDGSVSVSDANHGYREIIMINKQLDALKNMGYNDHSLRELRAALSDSVTANVGLGKFVTKGRQYRGLIEEINGANESKYGFFKSKVQSRPQDLSARSTIIPNPKLGMDHVGIPKKMAFKIYQPFVIRGLVQNGFTPMEAKKMLEDQSPEALSILQSEVESRPVLMNRAPELHKFNIMSYKPILIDGKAIETNPLTIISMNGDYDGDTVGIHVPVSEAARKEALTKLLPSRNLISPRSDTVMHMPVKETVLGIYLLTAPKGKAIKVANMAAAKKLVATGKIKENTAVLIGDTTHCVGQSIVNDVFPEELQPGLVTINAKQLDALVLDVSRLLDEDKTSAIISKLKDLGNHYVTYLGYAVSLRDLDFDYKKRDAVMRKLDANTKRIGFEQAAVEANKELDALVAAATDNRFVEATVLSKSTGKAGAVRQMIASPVAMTDAKGEVIPFAVRKSFAEGHDLGSYLGTTPGARQGLVDKGITVASTGYLSRLLVNANIENKVSTNDCGTMDGLVMPVDGDVIYRYGAEGEYRNKLITPSILNNYKRNTKNKTIKVRSSLKCKASSGICAMCAGANPEGKKYNQGFNLGTQSAQSVGERATQVTLSSFHTGGALGGAKVGFGRIEELFKLPNVSKGRAVLSEESGRVEMIRKASSGGSFIVINGNDHFVPAELGVKVNLGDQVRAGQQLSVKGNVNPQDLLNATGDINLTRNVMIDELTKAYSGQKINRRVFENVLKPMTDRAKVTHQGDGAMLHNVYAGEIYQVNKLEEYNDSLKKKGLRPIKYEPILLGISAIPHQTNDFIGQMTHERLKDTIKGAASFSKGTHITKGHTISQLVLKQFGHVEDIKNPLKKLF